MELTSDMVEGEEVNYNSKIPYYCSKCHNFGVTSRKVSELLQCGKCGKRGKLTYMSIHGYTI